jgi:hypothetical protein
MPHAWGNLTKDWNYAILDGFRKWDNPEDVDWVVLAQNDVTWKADWVKRLPEFQHLQMITQPKGDQAIALRIGAVRRLGFFDERFSLLHYQEVDYFLRAALQLGDEASINDMHEGEKSAWNSHDIFMIHPTFQGINENENLHTLRFHDELAGFFMEKWHLRRERDIHHLADMMKRRGFFLKNLPNEINWYPFFWDKCPELPRSLRWYVRLAARGKRLYPRPPVLKLLTLYLNRQWASLGKWWVIQWKWLVNWWKWLLHRPKWCKYKLYVLWHEKFK